MPGYTGEELRVVEQDLQKIKAIAELMTLHEWEPAFSLSPQSFTELGHILGGYAKEALAVFGPPAKAPEPEAEAA